MTSSLNKKQHVQTTTSRERGSNKERGGGEKQRAKIEREKTQVAKGETERREGNKGRKEGLKEREAIERKEGAREKAIKKCLQHGLALMARLIMVDPHSIVLLEFDGNNSVWQDHSAV
jgi:hypothetical protein